jgi:hypothetical protein
VANLYTGRVADFLLKHAVEPAPYAVHRVQAKNTREAWALKRPESEQISDAGPVAMTGILGNDGTTNRPTGPAQAEDLTKTAQVFPLFSFPDTIALWEDETLPPENRVLIRDPQTTRCGAVLHPTGSGNLAGETLRGGRGLSRGIRSLGDVS